MKATAMALTGLLVALLTACDRGQSGSVDASGLSAFCVDSGIYTYNIGPDCLVFSWDISI